MNTAGQAVGWESTGGGVGLPTHHAEVWSYTTSAGSLVSQNTTDLQNNGSLAAAYPGVNSSQALAVNSAGTVVVGACTSALDAVPNIDTAYFLYNMSTQEYTSLGSLMLYDPIGATTSTGGGHDQAINNAGQVVGQIATSSGGYDAAIWQNGLITDLNTEYAGILPAHFTLNNATAIDNNGDIAGWGTDSSNNTYQAFVIINPQLPGDANLDGKVDINDLTIVLAHYNQTGTTWTQGEFTGDGTVDINDLTIVLAHYGDTAGSAAGPAAAVPEPSAVVLIGIGDWACWVWFAGGGDGRYRMYPAHSVCRRTKAAHGVCRIHWNSALDCLPAPKTVTGIVPSNKPQRMHTPCSIAAY